MLVSGRVFASEKSELIFGFFRTIAEELNKLLVDDLFCCSKVSDGHPAIRKEIQKYLISEKKCVFFCGPKNGSDLKCDFFCGPKNGSDFKFKKNVIFFVVPKMDLILNSKKMCFFLWSPKWI